MNTKLQGATERGEARANGGQLFSVRLIDRRTGEVPRLNGIPLSLLTHSPRIAASQLLRGRDRGLWRAVIEPLRSGEHGHGVAV